VIRAVLLAVVITACGFPEPPRFGDDGGVTACSDCRLVAIEPAIAQTNNTITLEGTFEATAIVHFPGGATADATVEAGQHRATVVVPAGAGAGTLAVETGGGLAPGAVAFRRVDFTPALDSFQGDYQTDSRQTPQLVRERDRAVAITIGGYVYLIGASPALAAVERATINADGTLGGFADTTTPLAVPRLAPALVVIGDWLYVIGGADTSRTGLTATERAAIAPDGSLGAFATVDESTLGTGRFEFTLTVVGDFLYAIGGQIIDNQYTNSIERAPIGADGSVGAFTSVADRALVVARGDHAAAVLGDTLYIVGGNDRNGGLTSVERAPVGGDGELGAFTTDPTTQLVGPHEDTVASLVLGHRWYIWGGRPYGPGIEAAEIDEHQQLGGFSVRSITAQDYSGGAVAIAGNYVYTLGPSTFEAYRAPIDAGAQLGTFALASPTLVTPRAFATAMIAGSHAYVIGGDGATGFLDSVEQSTIGPDGTLGTFSVFGPKLATPRYCHASVVVGNWLYVIGGGGAAAPAFASIERAPISDDGTLGDFEDPGIMLTTARHCPALAIVTPWLYVMGGDDPTTVASIERAPITAANELGPFEVVTGHALDAPRSVYAAIRTENIFVFGGTADTSIASIGFAPGSDLEGSFTTVAGRTITSPRSAFAIAEVASSLYMLGGDFTTTKSDAVDRAPLELDPGFTAPFTAAGTLTQPRAGATAITTARGVYVVGGRNVVETNSIEFAPVQ